MRMTDRDDGKNAARQPYEAPALVRLVDDSGTESGALGSNSDLTNAVTASIAVGS
jgi:hypothetical protein